MTGFAVGAAAVLLAAVSIALAIACIRHGLWLTREWQRQHRAAQRARARAEWAERLGVPPEKPEPPDRT
jgi:hypothetical protein